MGKIIIKNKRGKQVAVLSWESPTELVSWAESIGSNKELQFNGVDAETPVLLEAGNEPIKKSKPVNEMSGAGIEFLLNSNVNDLMALKESLQKEFEYAMSNGKSAFVLKLKKMQLTDIDRVIDYQNEMLCSLGKLKEKQEKTELCLMNYGVSSEEYRLFVSRDLNEIEKEMLERREEKSVMIPWGLISRYRNELEPVMECVRRVENVSLWFKSRFGDEN